MFSRVLGASLLASSVLLGACSNNDNNGTNPTSTATVQVVNASSGNLDIGTGGTYSTANTNLGFGTAASCMTVNTASPNLTFRQNGTTTTIGGFTPNFTAGGNYTVVVSGSPGNYRVQQYQNTFPSLTSTQGAVRVINASTSTQGYDVYFTPSGGTMTTANSTNLTSNGSTSFLPLTAGTTQFRLTNTGGTSTVAYNSANNTGSGGNLNLTAGGRSIFVVADPATGTTGLRAFNVNACQ